VVDDAAYAAEAAGAMVFIPPIHPGDSPAIGGNAATITEASRRFLADGKEYALYINTDTALTKQLLQYPSFLRRSLRIHYSDSQR
jgi:hypothetical protein